MVSVAADDDRDGDNDIMPWYNSGDWSNAGGQDLPYIIAELWTAINQRQFVKGKILNPLESDSWVEDNYLSPLPGTADVYYPTASDLDGEAIHTPIYVNGIYYEINALYGGVPSSDNAMGGFVVSPSDFRFYGIAQGLDWTYPDDEIPGSYSFALPPFVFYLPFWDQCRKILDLLKYMCVDFRRASYYDDGVTVEPVTYNASKKHQNRFASTWAGMLDEEYDDVSEIRNDARLQANHDGGISEQRNFIELAGFAYSFEDTVNEVAAYVQHDFPFSFVVSAAWGRLNQRRHGGLKNEDPDLAKQLYDDSAVTINNQQHFGKDLEVETIWDQNHKYVNTFYAGAQLIDGLDINPEIEWSSIPSATAFEDPYEEDPPWWTNWSWVNNFYFCARLIGESSPAEREMPLHIITDISSELDDQ